jgi:streptogramin lyase
MRIVNTKGRSARCALALALAIGVAATGLAAAPAQADPVGDYSQVYVPKARANGPVYGVTAGPGGNMWYTRYFTNRIGRIAPSGAVREFQFPGGGTSSAGLFDMAAGPDGNMWFTAFNTSVIGRITPSGDITTYPTPTANSRPFGIAAGPDGNLWFTEDFANAIGRITPDGVITEFPIPAVGAIGPAKIESSNDCVVCGFLITAGPDGALWFTMPAASRIGRITVDGAITSFPVVTSPPPPSNLNPIAVGDITAGADGNLWFTMSVDNQIGRMTPTGVVTAFNIPTPASDPNYITPGPDGSLWFSEYAASTMAKISLDGVITEYRTPGVNTEPGLGAAGADGSIWFSEQPARTTAAGSTQYPGRISRIGTGVGPVLTSKVSGTGSAGSPLTCSYRNTTGWKVASVKYQWLRNGSAIRGATMKSLTPNALATGSSVRCTVSVTYAPALTQLGSISAGVRITQ